MSARLFRGAAQQVARSLLAAAIVAVVPSAHGDLPAEPVTVVQLAPVDP